jgi:cytochrome P450
MEPKTGCCIPYYDESCLILPHKKASSTSKVVYSMMDSLPSSDVSLLSVSTITALAIGLAVYVRPFTRGRSSDGGDHRTIPNLAPWYLPGLLEIVGIAMAGSIPGYVRKRRKQLPGSFNFKLKSINFLFPATRPGPFVIVSHPDDILKIYGQQRKLELVVVLPDTVDMIHGLGNLQSLTGSLHAFHRKIYSSLLSPRVLEGFVPDICQAFDRLWNELDETNGQKTVTLRDEIRKAQFYLMSKILYGIDVDLEPELAHQLQTNFEHEDAALFASKGSKTFKKGLESSKETRTLLWGRFQTILEDCRKKMNASDEQATISSSPPIVGNAFHAIAQALIDNGRVDDTETLDIVQDNLILLLEASHSTTMNVTTSLMYFLNHPDNRDCLERVRSEVQNISTEASTGNGHPSLSDLKDEMPYCDGCIKETQRLCPIIGSVILHLPKGKGKSIELRDGTHLSGPLHIINQSSNWYLDPETFPEPDRFMPERWLDDDNSDDGSHPLKVTALAKQAFMPWGGGVHICLGMKLAQLVLKANVYCFAKDSNRFVSFDADKVKPAYGLFPECAVIDGLPSTVHTSSRVERNSLK